MELRVPFLRSGGFSIARKRFLLLSPEAVFPLLRLARSSESFSHSAIGVIGSPFPLQSSPARARFLRSSRCEDPKKYLFSGHPLLTFHSSPESSVFAAVVVVYPFGSRATTASHAVPSPSAFSR
jgi:hypothetical protein